MQNNKTFLLLAGANGAGKSTLSSEYTKLGYTFINPDDIQKNKNLSFQETGRYVLSHIKKILENTSEEKRLALETTLSGNTWRSELKIAKRNHWDTQIVYVGLASRQLHIDRVNTRVQTGGHHVPRDTIVRRYDRSLNNIIPATKMVNRAVFYDNTNLPLILMTYENQKLKIANVDVFPKWAENIKKELSS